MDIVYRVGGEGYEGALFAERSTAERVAATYAAIDSSTSWTDFRTALPDGEWELILENTETEPADWTEPYTADDVPGYSDGDYPEWIAHTTLDWFPRELIVKHGGEIEDSVHNGFFLTLPAESAPAVAADLRAMGHRVEETSLVFR